ncbi:hypothetical protein U9M48_003863, partial [Paspalum notatum var. saurae]
GVGSIPVTPTPTCPLPVPLLLVVVDAAGTAAAGTAGGSGGGCCLLEEAGLSFLFFSSISPRFALRKQGTVHQHMVTPESLTEPSLGEAFPVLRSVRLPPV